ncbi:hypothetical protein [Methylocystis heyeri]|nr:hypothetical protein [Methylocystis heyeri]
MNIPRNFRPYACLSLASLVIAVALQCAKATREVFGGAQRAACAQ